MEKGDGTETILGTELVKTLSKILCDTTELNLFPSRSISRLCTILERFVTDEPCNVRKDLDMNSLCASFVLIENILDFIRYTFGVYYENNHMISTNDLYKMSIKTKAIEERIEEIGKSRSQELDHRTERIAIYIADLAVAVGRPATVDSSSVLHLVCTNYR